jgi:hypothetical protein
MGVGMRLLGLSSITSLAQGRETQILKFATIGFERWKEIRFSVFAVALQSCLQAFGANNRCLEFRG